MADTLLTSVEDGIATLRLNRPGDMNSLDADTARSIRAAVEGFAGAGADCFGLLGFVAGAGVAGSSFWACSFL